MEWETAMVSDGCPCLACHVMSLSWLEKWQWTESRATDPLGFPREVSVGVRTGKGLSRALALSGCLCSTWRWLTAFMAPLTYTALKLLPHHLRSRARGCSLKESLEPASESHQHLTLQKVNLPFPLGSPSSSPTPPSPAPPALPPPSPLPTLPRLQERPRQPPSN